jgi:hypothetical protein
MPDTFNLKRRKVYFGLQLQRLWSMIIWPYYFRLVARGSIARISWRGMCNGAMCLPHGILEGGRERERERERGERDKGAL